jgi:hypothetical protein
MYQTPARLENVTGRGAFLTPHERVYSVVRVHVEAPMANDNHCFKALFAIAKQVRFEVFQDGWVATRATQRTSA